MTALALSYGCSVLDGFVLEFPQSLSIYIYIYIYNIGLRFQSVKFLALALSKRLEIVFQHLCSCYLLPISMLRSSLTASGEKSGRHPRHQLLQGRLKHGCSGFVPNLGPLQSLMLAQLHLSCQNWPVHIFPEATHR